MQIWLLRHGRAEPRSDAPDADRELTQRGRDELRDNLSYYRNAIGSDPVIWSSERVRAWQTAEILAEAYDGTDIVPCTPLGSGDNETLQQLLAAAAPARSYVLVGHEPWLSEFYKMETGHAITLRKGELIGFEFGTPAADVASGPLFLDDLQERLIKNFEVITVARNAYLEDPDDVETLHKFRVAVRRFRALISLLKPYLPKKHYASAQDNFRQIAGISSLLRELDVTIIWLESDDCVYAPARAQALRRQAERMRADERRIVEADIRSQACPEKLLEGLGIFMANLRYEELAGQSVTDVVVPRQERWAAQADRALEAVEGENLSELHPIRLKYKKVRYVGELYSDVLDEASIERARRAQKQQTEIGERCDRLFMAPLLVKLSEALDKHQAL